MLRVEIKSYTVLVPLSIYDNIIIIDQENNQTIAKVTFDLEIVECYYGFEPSHYIEIGKLLYHPTFSSIISQIGQGYHEAHSPINIPALSLYIDQCLKNNSYIDFAIASTALKDWELLEVVEQFNSYLKLKRRGSDNVIYLEYPTEVTIFSLWSAFNMSIVNYNPFSRSLLAS
jgi:hypothetical protein